MQKTSPQTTYAPSCTNADASVDPNAPDMTKEPRKYNLYLVARARKIRFLTVAFLLLASLSACWLGSERRKNVANKLEPAMATREFTLEPPQNTRDAAIAFTVDVNTASIDELSLLPTVGEALARRIVEYREAKGAFRSLDELANVKGLGVKKLARIQPYCFVGSQGEPREDE